MEMNRFQVPSPILEFQKDIVKDIFHEYVTTVNPYESLTTEKVTVAKSPEHYGLMIVIYGIGGVLIFLVICTVCYRCFMPELSNAAYSRYMREQDAILQERIRIARLENERNQNDVEDPENPLDENHDRTETIGQDSRTLNLQRTERPFSGIIETVSTAIRSHTAPKQLWDSHQNTRRETGTRHMPARDLQDYSPLSVTEPLNEETMFMEQTLCENGDSNLVTSLNYDTESAHDKRSRSFPTSPDIVRRRYSSQEATPRRSSSLR